MASLPAITLGGTITNIVDPSGVQVVSVSHALGGSPGACVLDLPFYRPFNVPDTAGATVQVSLDNNRIFTGYVFQAKYGEDPNTTSCMLYAFDDRALLQRQFVGNQDSYDANKVGFDMIFNKGGKPDRKPGNNPSDNEWHRNQRDAVFWTVGNIIDYMAQHYVSQFSDLTLPYGEFSGAAFAGNFPGEVAMTGASILTVLDEMMSLLGRESYAVDYAINAIYRVSQDDYPGSQVIYYMEGDPVKYSSEGDTQPPQMPDGPTVSSYEISYDGAQAFEEVTAISDYLQIETTLDTTGELILDTGYNAAQYLKRYRPSSSVENRPENMPADWLTAPWSPGLATRVDEDWTAYLTEEDMAGGVKQGNPVPDKECVWIQGPQPTFPEAGTWYRMKDGYEIEYDPPGFYVERVVSFYTGELDDPDPEDPDQERTPKVTEVDLTKTSADFAITVNVLRYEQVYGKAPITPDPLPWYSKLARALVNVQTTPIFRFESKMPVLTQDQDARYLPGWEDMPDGWYVDIGDDMYNQANGSLQATNQIQTELSLEVELPFFMFLGQRVDFTSNQGRTDFPRYPMVCAGLNWLLDENQMSLRVTAVNQLGGEYSGNEMTSEQMLNYWRAENMEGRRAAMIARYEQQVNPIELQEAVEFQDQPELQKGPKVGTESSFMPGLRL